MTKPTLKLVRSREDIDIYAVTREKIASIDWARVHIAADRRAPIDLPDTRRRWWRE